MSNSNSEGFVIDYESKDTFDIDESPRSDKGSEYIEDDDVQSGNNRNELDDNEAHFESNADFESFTNDNGSGNYENTRVDYDVSDDEIDNLDEIENLDEEDKTAGRKYYEEDDELISIDEYEFESVAKKQDQSHQLQKEEQKKDEDATPVERDVNSESESYVYDLDEEFQFANIDRNRERAAEEVEEGANLNNNGVESWVSGDEKDKMKSIASSKNDIGRDSENYYDKEGNKEEAQIEQIELFNTDKNEYADNLSIDIGNEHENLTENLISSSSDEKEEDNLSSNSDSHIKENFEKTATLLSDVPIKVSVADSEFLLAPFKKKGKYRGNLNLITLFDNSILDLTIEDFFEAIRSNKSVSTFAKFDEGKELVLLVPELGNIHITEDNIYSREVTVKDFVNTFVELRHNDPEANESPEYISFHLDSQRRFITNFNHLSSLIRSNRSFKDIEPFNGDIISVPQDNYHEEGTELKKRKLSESY